MTPVDINHVRRLNEERRKINRIPFKEIIWMDGDKPVDVPQQLHNEWEFTGLNNIDFVEYGIDNDTKEPT